MTDKKYISRYELSIVRAFAGATESICKDYKLDIQSFLKKIVKTDIFKNFEEEHTVYTQGDHCIAGILLEHIADNISDIPDISDEEVLTDMLTAYWMGYILMYWKLAYKEDFDLIKDVNIENLYWLYDSLHTCDILYAIDKLKE